jgi:predicted MFS family arabinose efflux permease
MYGELYYVSIYLQSVKGLSPVRTGIGLLPVSLALMPSSVIVAFIISKLGQYRWALWLGWVVTITASGLAILLREHTHTVAWVVILAIVGLGHGILFNALLVAAQAASPANDVAYAASMYTFFRTLGFAFGVTIGATTLQNLMASNLKSSGLSTAIASDAAGYVSVLQAMSAGSVMREKIISAYVYGTDGVFEVLTGIAGLGLLATGFVARSNMNVELSHVRGAGDIA